MNIFFFFSLFLYLWRNYIMSFEWALYNGLLKGYSHYYETVNDVNTSTFIIPSVKGILYLLLYIFTFFCMSVCISNQKKKKSFYLTRIIKKLFSPFIFVDVSNRLLRTPSPLFQVHIRYNESNYDIKDHILLVKSNEQPGNVILFTSDTGILHAQKFFD